MLQYFNEIIRKLVSVNNVATVNSNVYFCVRTEASGEAMGVGYLGGGCNKKVSFRSAIQEWEGNDLYTARETFKFLYMF